MDDFKKLLEENKDKLSTRFTQEDLAPDYDKPEDILDKPIVIYKPERVNGRNGVYFYIPYLSEGDEDKRTLSTGSKKIRDVLETLLRDIDFQWPFVATIRKSGQAYYFELPYGSESDNIPF